MQPDVRTAKSFLEKVFQRREFFEESLRRLNLHPPKFYLEDNSLRQSEGEKCSFSVRRFEGVMGSGLRDCTAIEYPLLRFRETKEIKVLPCFA